MDTIHIAYALNDKYAEMTCVSMCSVLANCEGSEIVFHIFAEKLSQEHTEKLVGLSKGRENISVCFQNILLDSDLFVTAEYDILGAPKLTKEAYTPILIPKLLPNLEKALFLDCDTIVEGNIAQLWKIDLDDALAGMIPNYWMDSKETIETRNQILGFEESGVYFNTGVILMNLSGLRKCQLARIAAENVGQLYKQITEAGLVWLADQDVLNFALCGKVKKLPMRYNSNFWISQLSGENIDECIEALLNPVIIHFLGTPKPIELGNAPVLMPEWERYYKYKATSPFATDHDAIKIAIYKAREDITLDALKPYFDHNCVRWYCLNFTKQIFESALRRYKTATNGKNIVIWGLNERTWTLVVFLAAHGLEVKSIVDGLESNQEIAIFDYVVESPDVLRGGVDETFVMLDMRNYDIARQIMADIQSWGYTAEDYCYVYAPIWEGLGI